jgi:short-subunit dehydrogenase
MDRRLALVTGASAGIGAAFARLLATRGYDLALTARRTDRLEALAGEIRGQHGVEALVVSGDLADPAAPAAILAQLAAQGRSVDVLVNNAGYGLTGTFAATSWADQAAFIQVMMTAPSELAHRTLPGMRARGYGRIVNVASLAGLLPGGGGHTLYAAVKAYMLRFSESLHTENLGSGVHVSALCPGLTWSEFHDANGTRAQMDATPGWMWMAAEPVVAAGWAAVEANRPISLPGAPNKAIAALARALPESWGMKLMAAQGARVERL